MIARLIALTLLWQAHTVAPCPFGYALSVAGDVSVYPRATLEALAAGSFYGYRAGWPAHPIAGTQQYELIWIESDGTTWQPDADIEAWARARPGALWIVGNEPDNENQGNQLPEVFAGAYLRFRALVLGADPTARIANGATTEWTLAREAWYTRVWDAGMSSAPPDVWNVHAWVITEGPGGMGLPPGVDGPVTLRTWADRLDAEIMRADLRRFKAWLAARGEARKPLVVSEYGLPGAEALPLSVAAGFALTRSMAMFRAEGIDAYLLSSLDNDGRWGWGTGARLVYADTGQLTPLGYEWARYVRDPRNGYEPCGPVLSGAVYRAYLPVAGGEAWLL